MKTYKYKDDNRVYWCIELEKDRPDISRICEGSDEPDHIWKYRIINEDTNTVVHAGEVWEQYSIEPDLYDILGHWQTCINYLCLGMVKYATPI